MYHAWRRLLPAMVEVCPILLPGREGRLSEAPYTDSKKLIEEMSAALAGWLDTPYAIFGHSMGALLAFELAQRLRASGAPAPGYLFVSGRIAPHLPWGDNLMHRLNDEEFIARLNARYGGLPQELLAQPDLLEVYLPILRADLTLLETHEHIGRPALDCPIFAAAGEADANVSDQELAGWSEHTAGDFSSRRFSGGHFYLLGPGRASLLAEIAQRLTSLDPLPSGS